MSQPQKMQLTVGQLSVLEGTNLPADTLLEITIPDKKTEKVVKKRLQAYGQFAKKRNHKFAPDRNAILKIIERKNARKMLAGISRKAFEPDPYSMAILRGKKIAAEDLKRSGGAYSLEQVQALLNGISRQAIEKRVQEGSLFAVPGPNNRKHYPVIQFYSDGRPVKGLKEVIKAIPTDNPWDILNFLTNADYMLDNRRPIDVLKNGEIDKVIFSASRIGEMGN
jgi:hypothetical protein